MHRNHRAFSMNRSARIGLTWLSLVAFVGGGVALAQQADTSPPMRVEISLEARRLWVIGPDADTLYSASVAVGSGRTLQTDERTWKFQTPVGLTKVIAKEVNPVWVPPDWHYVELARERGLRVERLTPNDMVVLSGNRLLVANGTLVGVVGADSVFRRLPAAEEIVFDGTLFIPPFGAEQRRVSGVLGPYRLRLANGVGLHGTPYKDSIGKAATHGCIRLHDDDITWLYENVPIGTEVVIRR
jgi:hypothetical protein